MAHTDDNLWHNRSYLGMLIAQFFGAFNDNVFKQLILLWVAIKIPGEDYQGPASFYFALPFILFSGIAGFWSDLFPKRYVVILSKVGEILIMVLGMFAFLHPSLNVFYALIFMMGAQSAFFGPSKYGILPEVLPSKHIPTATSIFQMTTFLSIIFGFATAGYLAQYFPNDYWICVIPCIFFAVVGTISALLVEKTPPAQPDSKFSLEALAVHRDSFNLLRRDNLVLQVVVVVTIFWGVGGFTMPAVNAYGLRYLNWEEGSTSLLLVTVAIGLAIGCSLSGMIANEKIRFVQSRIAAGGLAGSMGLLMVPIMSLGLPDLLVGLYCHFAMLLMGVTAGLMVIPLWSFLQIASPTAQKGRIFGVVNLFTWMGIALSSIAYGFTIEAINNLNLTVNLVYCFNVLLLLPVVFFFHAPDTAIDDITPLEAV